MYVCMYVCMYVRKYACMYVCMVPNCHAARNIAAGPSHVRLPATVTKDTLCNVAVLSPGLEDILAYYTAEDFVAVCKKTLAFQAHVLKQKAARKVAMLNIGMEDTLAYCTLEAFAAGFLKSLAFQTCIIK